MIAKRIDREIVAWWFQGMPQDYDRKYLPLKLSLLSVNACTGMWRWDAQRKLGIWIETNGHFEFREQTYDPE